MVASRVTPQELVLVMVIGPSTRPASSIQAMLEKSESSDLDDATKKEIKQLHEKALADLKSGEEFAVLFPGVSIADARDAIEQLRESSRDKFRAYRSQGLEPNHHQIRTF